MDQSMVIFWNKELSRMQLTKMELISKAQNNFNKLVSLLAEICNKHPDLNRWKIKSVLSGVQIPDSEHL